MSDTPRARPRLGRFEVVARLAVGGMAEIFLAREVGLAGLERPVVVKRILPHLAADPEFVELFLQEARVVARLQHPGIVQIYELGEADGTWYIAMEYVPGTTLKQLESAAAQLKQPVPYEVALAILMQACEGAHAAHELTDSSGKQLGIVHRDVSPHNLMVTDDGHVKLLDFGIAKSTATSEATRTGGVKGKTSYLSPEQCRQEPLDRRSDVFALGIVLWELVAGASLFKRESEYETLQAIDRGELKDLRQFRPDVPEALLAVLQKALARDRADRFASAEALRLALAKVAEELHLPATRDAVKAFAHDLIGDRRREERSALERVFNGQDQLSPQLSRRLTGGSRTDETASLSAQEKPTEPARGKSRPFVLLGAIALVIAVLAGVVWRVRPHRAVSGPPLLMGFPPTIDREVMSGELEPLRTYLEAKTGRPFNFVIADSYADLIDRMVEGKVAFGLLTPNMLLVTRAREPKVEPLASDLFDGSTGNNGVILVLEQSPVNALGELRGHRVCLTDNESTTGFVLPRAALREAGLDPDHDLQIVMSGNHLQAMRDLSSGRCDAAGTYDKAYLTADRAGVPVARMRVLQLTGRAPNDTVSAAPHVSKHDRELVKQALLQFDPQRDVGRPVLGNVERISGFAPVDESAFDRLRKAIAGTPKP